MVGLQVECGLWEHPIHVQWPKMLLNPQFTHIQFSKAPIQRTTQWQWCHKQKSVWRHEWKKKLAWRNIIPWWSGSSTFYFLMINQISEVQSVVNSTFLLFATINLKQTGWKAVSFHSIFDEIHPTMVDFH